MKCLFLSLAVFFTIVECLDADWTNPCGENRSSLLPDPGPGTCNDVDKCCDWTWPPPLTANVSCETGACASCQPPDCCCNAGMMVLTIDGGVGVASCCDYFLSDNGTMCTRFNSNGTQNCGPDAALCKAFGQADCDQCAARCIEWF